MTRILHLGAGRMAIDTIRELRDAGFEVFAVDRNASAPAATAATGFAAIDFRNAAAVEEYARRIDADVLLPISDIGVVTAAAVNETLALPGIRPEVARRYVNKGAMRAAWRDAGLRQPRFALVNGADDIVSAATEIGFPLVVKPSVNAGSRGVSIASARDDLAWSIEFARKHSPDDTFVVEEFIAGMEVTVEGLVRHGEAIVLTSSDKEHQRHRRFLVAMSLNYPAKLEVKQRDEIHVLMKRAVAALGAYDGAFHAECIVNDAGAHLVEIHARGGGGHIFGRIVKAVSGISMPVATVGLMLGETVDLSLKQKCAACYRFFAPPPGRFVSAEGIDIARQLDGVLDLGFDLQPGTLTGAIAGDADRPGFVVTTGATREEAIARADRAVAMIRFHVEVA